MSVFLKSSLLLLISTSLIGAAQALELDTMEKKVSYTFGYLYIQQFKQQGTKLDMEAFSAAANDVQQGNSIRMSNEEMSATMQAYRKDLWEGQQSKAEAALQAGQLFMERNKTRPGIVVLPSGLQYVEHEAGAGGSPSASSKVTVNYRGTLTDGTEFDSSKPGKPSSFELTGIIGGFREALTMMKPGAKWTVYIPSDLAYGAIGSGKIIGPHEPLIFDVELISWE